ncbi:putative DNA primase/helicase [Bradyrhizobium sp. USDA 4502]
MRNIFQNVNECKLRIIERYGPEKNGLVHCPAHDDTNASLQVTIKDGKLLWRCHAGCTQEAVRDRLVADGLWSAATTSRGSPGHQTRERLGDEVKVSFREILDASIPWPDLDDEQRQIVQNYARSRQIELPVTTMFLPKLKSSRLVGRRFPAMVFEIVREDEAIGAHVTWLSSDGHSKLDVDDPKRTYGGVKGGNIRLHKRYDRRDPIVVAEGIETALSVERITGLRAIVACNATNLGKISVPKCSEVIIAADNDPSRAGIKGANDLARRLSVEGRLVRVALPYPRGDQKRDWNDELCEPDADVDALNRQIREARQYDIIGAVSTSQFLQMDFPPRPNMLHPWLPTAGLAMVHAPRGAAKTWFCLSAAHAVVTGKMFLEWKVNARGRVLYVDGELPASVLQNRLRHFEWDGCEDDLLILTPDIFHQRGRFMPDLGDPEGRDQIDAIVGQQGIDLIILDSLSTLQRSGGEENAAESWINIQNWALKLRSQGRSIIFVHHEGRNNKPRGTSKREDTLDTMIGLSPLPNADSNDCTTIQLEFTKHRGFFGAETAPRVLQLSTETKRAVWSAATGPKSNRDRVFELRDQGMQAADIARELNITRGRVSQILNEPREREE